MSRIGKKLIKLPHKVELQNSNGIVVVKGPKGQLSTNIGTQFDVLPSGNEGYLVQPSANTRDKKNIASLWGITRTLVSNMITGVSTGFSKDLEFTGVGYRASIAGKVLTLNLGFSHSIDYPVPSGIEIKVNKNIITVEGFDKELVGRVSSEIRAFRPPEPYKGKGIKYSYEKIIRKAGKTGAKK